LLLLSFILNFVGQQKSFESLPDILVQRLVELPPPTCGFNAKSEYCQNDELDQFDNSLDSLSGNDDTDSDDDRDPLRTEMGNTSYEDRDPLDVQR